MDSTDWDQRYLAADHLWSHGPNIFVADRLAHLHPGRGLDLGCGEGRNAVWLAERGWVMTAVDFSPVAIERGTGRGSGVDFVVADVRTWDPGEVVFDLILIAYIHLVMPELADLVRQARSWLSPGGELFMIGHDRSNIEHGHGGPQDPEILWDVAQIRDSLEGMETVEAQVVRRPTEEGTALDALVRARRPS
ncbi:MAG: methyltransferase domain-containing protein [Actinobacteria bacterium]|nr:methyltransferase domain-containing protein [Actinomycetota bacterium]